MNIESRILKYEYLYGPNTYKIFDKIGREANVTDYAILTGAESIFSKNGKEVGEYIAAEWDEDVHIVGSNDSSKIGKINQRNIGVRPNLDIRWYEGDISIGKYDDGVRYVYFGSYPQYAVPFDMQLKLDTLYRDLKETGYSYTTDARKNTEYKKNFLEIKNPEFMFDDKRYVRLQANMFYDKKTLSNGITYKNGDYVWLEVTPVKWIVLNLGNSNIELLSEDILFSGIQFQDKKSFPKYSLRTYLHNIFKPELVQHGTFFSKKDIETKQDKNDDFSEVPKKDQIKLIETNFSSEKEEDLSEIGSIYNLKLEDVDEEELIRGTIESGIPLFLHGKDGDGKCSRIKRIDPNCQVISIKNTSVESLNGVSFIDQDRFDQQFIRPAWLKSFENKCNSDDETNHILYFDKITSADKDIQKIAYSIAIDRIVNGMWKLPNNASVVVSGDEIEESIEDEIDPDIYNRFAHINIETTTESWIKWATRPDEYREQIHPAIIAFLAYKSDIGDDVLRTDYDGVIPNADPRKWEMCSKILYKTKKPEMLKSLVGPEITNDFIEFCRQAVFTAEDILGRNYTEHTLKMSVEEQYATIAVLSSVSDANFEEVREVVKKIGEHNLPLFDNLWISGDPKRLEKIKEITEKELLEEER